MSDDTITVVTMAFDATDPDAVVAALARYVVLTRMRPGCRNVDLLASAMVEDRYLVIEKWGSGHDQQAHLSSPELAELAAACEGRLAQPPVFDLLDGVSAHDLR